MTLNPELVNLGIPLAICLLSALPFLFIQDLGKKEDDPKTSAYYTVISYLLILGLGILVFVLIKSIGIMSFNNGNRALFICAILLVACLDRLIDLWANKVTIKGSLINRLQYFVTLLCSIPIIWQLLIHIVPSEISGKSKIMNATEILLMFIMLALGMINRPTKKKKQQKTTDDLSYRKSASKSMDTNLRPHIQNQLSKFNELWLETRNSWPPPGFTIDKHTRKNWGLIAVPEAEAWQHVVEIIDVFSKSWPWNVAYTLPQLHVTIASLGTPTSWKGSEEILDAILRQVAVHEDPIEIDFHGLNLLRNTIIVQVIDKQDKFRKLVSHITELVTEAGLAKNLKIGIHDRLWWTSAIRLYQPIPDDILNFVDSFKNIFLGSTIIDSIKLIENNKTHDPLEVKLIDSYKFSRKSK